MLRERGRRQRHVVRPESGPPPDLLWIGTDGAKILHGLGQRSPRRLCQVVLPVDPADMATASNSSSRRRIFDGWPLGFVFVDASKEVEVLMFAVLDGSVVTPVSGPRPLEVTPVSGRR